MLYTEEYITVSLFGHREIENFSEAEKCLYSVVNKLVSQNERVNFLIGRNGVFDLLSASVIRLVKSKIGAENCIITCVLPYITAEYRDNISAFDDYYDEVIVYDQMYTCHYKKAISERNKYMIDRSDEVIFYVDHASGGAYQMYLYAKKAKKKIINFGILQE